MPRTPLFQKLARSMRLAHRANAEGISTQEALARREEATLSRRSFLAASGAAITVGAIGSSGMACLADESMERRQQGLALRGNVAIVGAGMAGIACAYELQRYGVQSTLYEAGNRAGGRVYSLGGAFPGAVSFPGQIIERGGELIDTGHQTMRGYARELGLTLESYISDPGEVFYHFGGQRYTEAEVVDEYRAFVPAMRNDLQTIGTPTGYSSTQADALLDYTTLADYLDSRAAGPLIRSALDVAYTIEYGLVTAQQSALNLLLFIHLDRRSRFQPFGVFSDERFHVVEGNQSIPKGLAARLSRPITVEHRLLRVARRSDGQVELTLATPGGTRVSAHDAVVLATPFSTLRDVDLDASLALNPRKQRAIAELQYGTNAKLMVGFTGRPWADLGSNGVAYSDLPYLQNTWETNPSTANASRGVLTNYTGGNLGASLRQNRLRQDTDRFLASLDTIYPGAAAAARRGSNGDVVAHLEHWPSNPLSKGSYTCNHPGYFTTIADVEMEAAGNLYFAGEHTSSFYEWQGFMEGAALSGLRAAGEVAAQLKSKKAA